MTLNTGALAQVEQRMNYHLITSKGKQEATYGKEWHEEQVRQRQWTLAIGTLRALSLYSGSKQQLATRKLALR